MKKTLALCSAVMMLIALAPLAGALDLTGGRTASADAKPRVDAHLAGQLASAKAGDRLVVFVHGTDAAAAERAAKASGLAVVDRFNLVNVAVAEGTAAQIKDLSQTKGLKYLEANRDIQFHLNTAHKATRMDEARATIHDPSGNPFDGAGTTIAVVDSGIDGGHPMFVRDGVSKVVRNLKLACPYLTQCTGTQGDARDDLWVDFTKTTNDTDTPSASGHGTHVAGIAAGYERKTLDERTVRGAAPEAKLVGLSVGVTLGVYGGAAGLNWVLEHGDKPCVNGDGVAFSDPVTCPPVRVVNNSYGPTGGGEFDASSATVLIQQALVAKGVTVVWSAGNGDATFDGGDGSDVRTNPSGQDPTGGVIMVANYDDAGTGSADNGLDSSSSRGQSGRPSTYPDLSAPGTAITSSCRPQLVLCSSGGEADPDYNSSGGTSMAAPYVAGVAAVLRSAKPSITPAEIELAVEDTAHRFVAGAQYEPDLPERNPNTVTSFDKGHGLVDVAGALNLVLGGDVPLPPPGVLACSADGPVAVDPTGDATDFAVAGAFPISETALDVTRVDVSATEAGDTTFTVTVTELGELNPQTSPNIAFDTYFTFNGHDLWAEAARAVDGAKSYKIGQTITTPNATARVPLADVSGTFDVEANTISVTVPAAVMKEHGGKVPAYLDAMKGIETIARRSVTNQPSSQGQQADKATANCPFTYGLGAIPGPPPPPPPPPAPYTPPASEGTLTVDSPYEWSGGPYDSEKSAVKQQAGQVTGEEVSTCTRDETTPGCDRRGVTIVVPEGGATLTIDLLADNLVDDYDIKVFKPDGSALGTSEFIGPEFIEVPVTESGVYTMVVTGWAENQGPYTAHATLTVAEEEEPPPAKPAEGTASPGSPYTWEGATPVPVSPFACVSPAGETFCDNTYVQVDVPAGGGKLTITAKPEAPDTDEFHIYVYDPSGTELKNGTTRSGIGTWTVNVTTSGVYRIGITALVAADGYAGTASIA